MKLVAKRFAATGLSWLLAYAVLLSGGLTQAQTESGAYAVQDEPQISHRTDGSYASLSGMIIMICEDAVRQFGGFYQLSTVAVEPFVFWDEFSSKNNTVLGITLRDQMTAMINNSVMVKMHGGSRPFQQNLKGVLQEIDGFLRIHLYGMNASGERRSYVVNVEMSEPIYRALHSVQHVYANN